VPAEDPLESKDAPIRHWPIIRQPIIGKLTLLSYFSYLFRFRLLSEDSYLL